MKRPTRPTLYGPNGKPLAYGLYPTPRQSGLRNYRPRPFVVTGDTSSNYDSFDWQEGLNYSRQLFAQLTTLGGAVIQKNSWAFGNGWMPQYVGANRSWGEAAEEWLKEVWFPSCNVRGPLFDFQTSLFLDGIAHDIDGDSLMVCTKTETGWPQIQFVPAHRIKSCGEAEVGKGLFKGAKIINGVIFDRNLRAIAYRVEMAAGRFDDIPASSAQLLFEPEWHDQGRGIPPLNRGVLDWWDYQDIVHFLKRQVKQDSSQGIIRKTSDIPTNADLPTEETAAPGQESKPLAIEEIHGGEYWYLDADSDETLEPFRSERPHPNIDAFLKRIERGALYSIGWPIELTDPSTVGGASVRLITDIARQSIKSRQRTGIRRTKRILAHALAAAMENGDLPKNYDGMDFLRWKTDMPAELTVDSGNEENAIRENYKLGTTTLAAIAQRSGGNWTQIREQNELEIVDLIARAERVSAASKGRVTFEKALDLFTQRQPNGTPPQPEPQKQNETRENTSDAP